MASKWIEQLALKAPASAMFRGVFERILSDKALDKIFSEHRHAQVESTILFSHLVGMLVPVISGGAKSVNAVHQASGNSYSRQALYDKLKGVEAQVSSESRGDTTCFLGGSCKQD